MKILLVEDDHSIATSLVDGLGDAGFEVCHVTTGAAALAADVPDLVLLDLGLPDIDGYDVCRQLRASSTVPIIVVTARSDELDRVVGLELGADDYVVKPFGFRELVARIRAVGRRAALPAPWRRAAKTSSRCTGSAGCRSTPARAGCCSTMSRSCSRPRSSISWRSWPRTPARVHRRTEILESVWDAHWYGPTKTLDAHVAALRKKLGDPRWIEAVRGVGFRLEEPT